MSVVIENIRETVVSILPEIGLIGDLDLRRRVGAAWADAVREGNSGRGWTGEALEALPFTLLAGEIEMRFVEHVRCCARQCLAIAEVLSETYGGRVPIDRDVLLAGALLADVGKLYEIELGPDGEPRKSGHGLLLRHPFVGVALCERHGLPAEVAHIVATHSYEGDRTPRTIESIVFHHADFVDFDIAKRLGDIAKRLGGAS